VTVCGDTGAGVAQNASIGTFRLDGRLNDRVNMFARYGFDRVTMFPGAVSASPYVGFDTGAQVVNDRVELSVTDVLSTTAVLTGTFTFDRRALLRELDGAAVRPTLYSVTRPFTTIGDATATLAVPGVSPAVPGAALPSTGFRDDERVGAELESLAGSHTIRVGGAWTRVDDGRQLGDFLLPIESLGRSLPSALDGFVRGTLDRTDAALEPATPRDRAIHFDEVGGYV